MEAKKRGKRERLDGRRGERERERERKKDVLHVLSELTVNMSFSGGR
jgi:hypothetical protein